MKTLFGLLLIAIGIGAARCVAEADYWNHQQMTVGGITYNPYEKPICEDPNVIESLLGFPPRCHFRGE